MSAPTPEPGSPYPQQPPPMPAPQPYGQAPYGQPPYGQPPYGQMPTPPQPPGWNGLAIAGFICAFIIWPVGLVLCIIALVQIKKTHQQGKGLSIAGIIISSLAVIAIVIALVAGVFVIGAAVNAANQQPAVATVGTCFNLPANAQNLDEATIVDCAQPHGWETVSLITMTDASFPGDSAVSTKATAQCQADLTSYVGPNPGANINLDQLGLNFAGPTQASWALGDRTIICFAGNVDGSMTTGSIAAGGAAAPSPSA